MESERSAALAAATEAAEAAAQCYDGYAPPSEKAPKIKERSEAALAALARFDWGTPQPCVIRILPMRLLFFCLLPNTFL